MADNDPGANFGWEDPMDDDDSMNDDPMDDDIHKLVAMVTELGIEAENILFNAALALLGEGTLGAQMAREACLECERRYQQAHQFGLDLIMGGRVVGDKARWIMELQQLGQSFRRVAQDATWIALQSLALRQPIEDVLMLVGASLDGLEYLVEQARQQVRMTIVYASSRDRNFARRVLENAAEVQRSYIVLESRVMAAIREYPRISFPMQQLLGVATHLENIGVTCQRTATDVLYDPPSTHT